MELKNNILKGGIHYLTSDYKTRNSNRKAHNGMDFVGPNKVDDIVAVEDGIVNFTGYDSSGGGYWVSIKTNGIEHRYFHLAKNTIRVKKGETVKKGQVIATMGKTGNATGYNVHFAIYNKGYQDPKPYLMNDNPFNLNKEPENNFHTFLKGVQQALNVSVTELPNQETLNKTITLSQTKNNKHPVVKVLQAYLQSLGYDLGKYGIDGIYGPQMAKIIKEYQEKIVGLKGNLVDGVITAKKYTWQKLLKLS